MRAEATQPLRLRPLVVRVGEDVARSTGRRSSPTRPTSVPGPGGMSRAAIKDRYSSEPPDANASR